jgi:hypothetical protein
MRSHSWKSWQLTWIIEEPRSEHSPWNRSTSPIAVTCNRRHRPLSSGLPSDANVHKTCTPYRLLCPLSASNTACIHRLSVLARGHGRQHDDPSFGPGTRLILPGNLFLCAAGPRISAFGLSSAWWWLAQRDAGSLKSKCHYQGPHTFVAGSVSACEMQHRARETTPRSFYCGTDRHTQHSDSAPGGARGHVFQAECRAPESAAEPAPESASTSAGTRAPEPGWSQGPGQTEHRAESRGRRDGAQTTRGHDPGARTP